MSDKPYSIRKSGNLWVVYDTRNDQLASYPASKKKAQTEANYMNEMYAKLVSEDMI